MKSTISKEFQQTTFARRLLFTRHPQAVSAIDMKIIYLLAAFATLTLTGLAQENPAPNEKAARYHKLLLKRPDSGTLFERFVDSWLDTGSKEDLETFLKTSAEAGSAPEWRLLATYQDWMGREEQALQAITTALEKSPDSEELFFARAELKARLLDFEGALLDLEKGKESAGEEAAILKGTWLARAGRPEKALEAWKEILAARPDDEELREDLIELQVGEGLYDEAIATGRELTQATKDPYQKALRLMRVAAIEVMAGKREEGLTTFRKVLDMTGEDSWLEKEVLAQVEKVYRRDEDIVGLREFYQSLRQKFPQRVSLRKGLAAQMAANGEIDEAIELFREVLKITPGDLQNRQQFISLLENAERYDLAVEELQFVLRDQGEDPASWEHLARLRDLMNDKEGLLEALQKVRALRSETPAGVISTASLYERYQERAEAGKILRQGRTDFPEAIELSEALASFLASAEATKNEQIEATNIWLEMAKGADAEGLLRVSRALLAHRRADPCFTLLTERIAEFPENGLLLKQLCDAGLAADKTAEAFPHALQLARLAKTPTDLTSALNEVARLGRRLDLEDTLDDLGNQGEKTAIDWCVLAELRELQGDAIASEAALAEAAKLTDGPLVLTQRVRLAEARGEIEKAAQVMREILALPGGERPVHLRKLVTLLASAGDLTSALAETENWKRIAPGDKGAWLRRSELLIESGELEEAVNEIRRALAKFGDEEDLRSRLASTLVEAGEYTEGERLYRKLYEEADDASSKNRWIEQLATLAKQENRIEELLEEFERRKRRNSQEAGPLQALAKIHEILGDYEMQRESLAEAVRRKPNNVKFRLDLARLEERASDFDRAAATLKEAARLDRGSQARQQLADFYFRNGEIELGLDILRGLQGGKPREVETTVISLIQNREWETALDYLRETAETDWRLDFLTAIAFFQSDRKEEARAILRQLAQVDQEIEGLTPLVDDTTYKQWKTWLVAQGMTEDLSETIHHGMMQQTIHQIIQLTKGNGRSSRSYGGRNPLKLPGTAAEMRALAITYLKHDATVLSKGSRDELLAQIPFPKTRLGNRLKNEHRLGEWCREEVEAGRMELAEALYLGWQTEDFPIEILERAAKELVDSDPKMADWALQGLAQRKPEKANDYFLARLALLPKFEGDERQSRLDQLATVFFPNQGNSRGYLPHNSINLNSIKKESRASIRKLLQDELAAAPVAAKVEKEQTHLAQRAWFSALITDAWIQGDGAAFVALANRAILEHEAALNTQDKSLVYFRGAYYPLSTVQAWGWGRGGNQQSLQPPTFPRDLSAIPSNLQQLFQANQASQNQQAQGNDFLKKWLAHRKEIQNAEGDEENQKGMDPTDFIPLIPQLNSPLLRLLASHWAKDQAGLEKEIAALQESKDIDEVLLAAGYHYTQKDLLNCYQLLTRGRLLPMETPQRKLIDGHLSVVGMQLAQQKTPIEQLEVAQRAVLRLRRTIRQSEEMEMLTAAMTTLGLGDVVAQMQTARLRRGVSSRSRSSSRHGPSNRYTQALAEGNTEGAAREALRAMRPHLRNTNSSRWELEELVKRYQSAKLTDAIITLANPGETRSYTRRMEYVTLCELFDKLEVAEPVLIALAQERPDDGQVIARLARLLPKEEVAAKARELMSSESIVDFAQLVLPMAGYSDGDLSLDNRKSAEAAVNTIEITTEFLEKLEPSGSGERNLSWVLGLMVGGLEEWEFGDIELPALHLKANREWALESRRVAQTRKLLLAATRHPQIAEQSFALIDGTSKGFDWTEEELAQAAATAITARAQWETTDNDPYLQYLITNPWYVVIADDFSMGNRPDFAGRLPSVYLSEAILAANATPSSQLFQTLKKADESQAQAITLARLLSKGTDEEVEKALANWRDQLKEESKAKRQSYQQLLLFALVSKAPADRIAPIEKEFIKLAVSFEEQDQQAGSQIAMLVRSSYQAGGKKAAQQFLENYLVAAIGPRELWPEWKSLIESHGIRSEQLYYLQQNIDSLKSELCGQPLDLGFVLVLTEFEPLLNGSSYQLSEGLSNLFEAKNVADAEARLNESNFWNLTWAELGTAVDTADFETLWEQVLDNIGNYDLRRKLGTKLAKSNGGRRFRNRLAAVSLGSGEGQLLKEIEGMADKITAMSASEQAGVAAILRIHYPSLKDPLAGPKTTKLFELLGSGGHDEFLATVHKKIENGFDGSLYNYQGQQTAYQETSKLILLDTKLAVDYFLAALSDPQKKNAQQHGFQIMRQFGSSSSVTRQDELFGELMDEAGDLKVDLTNWARFQTALEAHEDCPPISVGHNDRYDLDAFAKPFWDAMPRPKNLTGLEKEIFPTYHWDELPKSFAGESSKVQKTVAWLLWLKASYTWNVTGKGKAHWQWIEESKYGERHPIYYARNLTLLAMKVWNELPAPAHEAARKVWLETLADPEVSIRLRMELACDVAIKEPRLFDTPEGVEAMTQLIERYEDQGRALHAAEIANFLKGFSRLSTPLPKERWNPLLQKCADSYLVLLGKRNSISDDQKAQFSSAMIQLAVESGNVELAKKVLNLSRPFLRGDLETMLILASSPEPELAKQLIIPTTELYEKPEDLYWSPKVAQQTETVLSLIGNESERYRVHCVLASLPDVKDLEGPSASERLTALAKDFTAQAPRGSRPRLQCLHELVSQDGPMIELEGVLKELTKKYTFAQTLDQDNLPADVSASQMNRIFRRYFWDSARRGNLQPVDSHLHDLAKVIVNTKSTRPQYETTYLCRTILDGMLRGLADEPDRKPSPEALQLSKTWYETFSTVSPGRNSYLVRTAALPFIIHALAGKSKEFDEWVATLPENKQKHYQNSIKKHPFYLAANWGNTSYWRSTNRSKARRAYLKALLDDEFAALKLFGGHFSVGKMVSYHTILEKEFLDVLDALPKDHPHYYKFSLERALYLVWTSKFDQKEGIADVRALMAEAKAEGNSHAANLCLAELVLIHGDKLKEPAKAVELHSQVEWKKVSWRTRNSANKKIKGYRAAAAKKETGEK